MLERFWKQASRLITVAAAVIAFLLVIELIRAYQTLRDLHPWAGYAFVAGLVALLAWLAVRLLGGWRNKAAGMA